MAAARTTSSACRSTRCRTCRLGATLLDHIRFSSAGADARLIKKDCTARSGTGHLLLHGRLCVSRGRRQARRRLHLSRRHRSQSCAPASRVNGGRRDQALFDFSFLESHVAVPAAHSRRNRHYRMRRRDLARGWRGRANPVPRQPGARRAQSPRACGHQRHVPGRADRIRARRGAYALAARASRFVEAAACADARVPRGRNSPSAARRRTLAIAGLLGTFHGLYFLLFLQSTGYAPGYVLLGAAWPNGSDRHVRPDFLPHQPLDLRSSPRSSFRLRAFDRRHGLVLPPAQKLMIMIDLAFLIRVHSHSRTLTFVSIHSRHL